MHSAIADGIAENLGDGVRRATATLDDPEHGLTEEVLAETDVLIWWGHAAHGEVADEVVERVHRHVLSGHGAGRAALRPLVEDLQEADGHDLHAALAQRARPRAGLDGRPDAPDRRGRAAPASSSTRRRCTASTSTSRRPDELVFISSFSGGEVFRSGCTFRRGHGKIFYFRPGDQDYPDLPPQGRPPGDRQRRRLGPHRPARARAADAAAVRDRTTSSTATATPDRSTATTTSRAMRPPAEPVRLILVGAGRHGPGVARRHRRQSPDVRLAGMVDLDLGRRTGRPPRAGAR